MDYLIFNLADPHLHALADAHLLSADEHEASKKRGARYILTRSLLRKELARRLGCSPQGIQLHYTPQGKPECEGIHFNLSHSGDCLAMAFDATPVGIDVERVRPRARLSALATRIMCPAQLAAFCERGCPQDEFYACWCAAEALVKQQGGSIWQAQEYPFFWQQGHICLPEGTPTTVKSFLPAPGYVGAVAFYRPWV